ncbi:MAG: hypothetical protein KatS3mg009_0013 [Acidimicrobiia bacterium]|nr:MAG: hypothetical protein KatS3mg009_0013 [Acidimicrobiia bacterium]
MNGVGHAAQGGEAAGTIRTAAVGTVAAAVGVVGAWSWRPSAVELVTPVVVVAGAAILLALALSRFWGFVLAALAVRASIDGMGAGGVVDPALVLGVMFLAAAAAWIVRNRDRDAQVPWSPLHWGLAGFVTAGGVSVIASEAPRATVVEVVRICTTLAMFLVVGRFAVRPRHRDQVLVALAVSAAVPVLVGLAAVSLGISPFETKGEFTRLTSTFAQSNTFARYLAVTLVAVVALHPHLTSRHRRAADLLGAGTAMCLVMTYTVGAWLAVAAGVCCVGLLQNRRIVVATLAAVIVAFAVAPGVSARVQDAGLGVEDDADESGSFDWRLAYWSELLPLASGSPVTGIGLGATAAVSERSKAPHNDLLAAYVETGLFGLGAYLLLLGAAAATARSALRREQDGIDRGVAVAFAACCVTFAVASLAANVMRSVALMWWMAALAGLVVAAGRREVVPAPADAR